MTWNDVLDRLLDGYKDEPDILTVCVGSWKLDSGNKLEFIPQLRMTLGELRDYQQPGTALGHRLRNLRQARIRSLKEVAAACQISTSHLSDLERGVAQPSVDVLRRLAIYHQASLDVLLDMP